MTMRVETGWLDLEGMIASAYVRCCQGVLVAVVVAITAQFLSEHYGVPAMLMALLLGIAFHFLAEEGRCVAGIDFTAKKVLRFGVALLGARISVGLLIELGAGTVLLIIAAVVATILIGLLGARLLGRGWRLALITGGSVAICGASAAMAIAAVLPKNEHSERNLLFTVMGVTVLSTIAMVLYPIIAGQLGWDDRADRHPIWAAPSTTLPRWSAPASRCRRRPAMSPPWSS